MWAHRQIYGRFILERCRFRWTNSGFFSPFVVDPWTLFNLSFKLKIKGILWTNALNKFKIILSPKFPQQPSFAAKLARNSSTELASLVPTEAPCCQSEPSEAPGARPSVKPSEAHGAMWRPQYQSQREVSLFRKCYFKWSQLKEMMILKVSRLYENKKCTLSFTTKLINVKRHRRHNHSFSFHFCNTVLRYLSPAKSALAPNCVFL